MKNKKVVSTLAVMSFLMLAPSISNAQDAVETSSVEHKRCGTKQPSTKKQTRQSKPSKKESQSEKAHRGQNKNRQHEKTGKGHMHEIQREIDAIIADFKIDGDVQAAKAKLSAMPAKIKSAVEQMQQSEEHGSMWKRHQHKMKEKLKEARNIVDGKHNA